MYYSAVPIILNRMMPHQTNQQLALHLHNLKPLIATAKTETDRINNVMLHFVETTNKDQ